MRIFFIIILLLGILPGAEFTADDPAVVQLAEVYTEKWQTDQSSANDFLRSLPRGLRNAVVLRVSTDPEQQRREREANILLIAQTFTPYWGAQWRPTVPSIVGVRMATADGRANAQNKVLYQIGNTLGDNPKTLAALAEAARAYRQERGNPGVSVGEALGFALEIAEQDIRRMDAELVRLHRQLNGGGR